MASGLYDIDPIFLRGSPIVRQEHRMRQRKLLIIIIPIVAIIAGLTLIYAFNAAWIRSWERDSDEVLINRTKDLPEVKAFLTKYQNPYVYVDRVDHFSVGYYVAKCELEGKGCTNDPSQIEPYIALRIRLNDNGYPQSAVLVCTPDSSNQFKIEENIVKYLEEGNCHI